jgi:hypothetical protein
LSFAEIINDGLNNPDCSFWVGMALGSFTVAKLGVAILAAGLLFKAIDKLAWEPFLSWAKKKLYRMEPLK